MAIFCEKMMNFAYNMPFVRPLFTFMQIIDLDPHIPIALPPHALTIGNFDGVHLGHEAMLQTLQKDAKNQSLATAVMVFEPQPREFFNPQNPPARLTNFTEKVALLDKHGIDFIIKADFNDDFRHLSAHAFTMLLSTLGTQHLVLGDDFRFGHDRIGDKVFLQNLGFGVDSLATVTHDNARISSTAVREALAQGDLNAAKIMLGRDYAMTGQVIHGDKIGRTLNFPTANVALGRLKPAIQGVFGVDVLADKDGQMIDLYALGGGIKGQTMSSLLGAVNVGKRPSVNGTDYRLEVHLPEFRGDLYGMTLTVIFKKYLHGERHYESLADLKDGINKDVDELMAWRNALI